VSDIAKATRNRQRLPDRRASVVYYTATVSRFSDDRLAEPFIDYSKPNSQLGEFANDAAVLVSLLLQHGVTEVAIRNSVATALDKIESES
jgi:hypothetical protein